MAVTARCNKLFLVYLEISPVSSRDISYSIMIRLATCIPHVQMPGFGDAALQYVCIVSFLSDVRRIPLSGW